MLDGIVCFRCRAPGHTCDECPHARAPLGRPSRAGPFTLTRPRAGSAFVLGRRMPPPPAASRGFLLGAGLEDDGVYVLALPRNRFYVGKSRGIAERLRQHAAGEGAACAKGFTARLAPMTPRGEDLEAWERAETLARMRRHGVGRVRGWMYTRPELTEQEREHAYQQVCERFDLCRRCGQTGHFAAACAAPAGQRPAWAAQ